MIEQLKDWVHGLEKLWQVASGEAKWMKNEYLLLFLAVN